MTKTIMCSLIALHVGNTPINPTSVSTGTSDLRKRDMSVEDWYEVDKGEESNNS